MHYIERLVDPLLDQLLAGLPAVLLAGPRASGKTTTARRRASETLALDRPAVAGAVAADPDAAIGGRAGGSLLCIDEWQAVPSVMGAVKRAIDADGGSGLFLLTGSVGAELGPDAWPATGRVVIVPVWGLCQRELAARVDAPSPVDVLFDGDPLALRPATTPLDLRDYLSLAMRGAFPDLVQRESPRVRREWLDAYVTQAVHRDAAILGGERDPRRLRRYLQAVARSTAGTVQHKTLYDAAQVSRPTGLAYDSLLEQIHLTEQVPAYSSNRLAQLTRLPKRYLADPALLGPLAGVDERACLRDADLLGRVIDTFVASQLRPELAVSTQRAELSHLREAHGRQEIDLVMAAPDGRVVAMEVKASAAPTANDARHLHWLAARLGEDFTAGVVFHTGPASFPLGERIAAVPISALWSTA